MKTKDLKDIKTLETKKLEDLISKKKLDLLKNMVKISKDKDKNIKKSWLDRKEIAQILTIINERKESK